MLERGSSSAGEEMEAEALWLGCFRVAEDSSGGIREGGNGAGQGVPTERRAWPMEWRPLSVLSQEPEVGPLAEGLGR